MAIPLYNVDSMNRKEAHLEKLLIFFTQIRKLYGKTNTAREFSVSK